MERGLGAFNHVIVRVDSDWFDPSAHTPHMRLPVWDSNRNALVVGDGSDDVERTPRASAEHHVYKEHRRLEIGPYSSGRIAESISATGAAPLMLGFGADEVEAADFTEYVADIYSGGTVESAALRSGPTGAVTRDLVIDDVGAAEDRGTVIEVNADLCPRWK